MGSNAGLNRACCRGDGGETKLPKAPITGSLGGGGKFLNVDGRLVLRVDPGQPSSSLRLARVNDALSPGLPTQAAYSVGGHSGIKVRSPAFTFLHLFVFLFLEMPPIRYAPSGNSASSLLV